MIYFDLQMVGQSGIGMALYVVPIFQFLHVQAYGSVMFCRHYTCLETMDLFSNFKLRTSIAIFMRMI